MRVDQLVQRLATTVGEFSQWREWESQSVLTWPSGLIARMPLSGERAAVLIDVDRSVRGRCNPVAPNEVVRAGAGPRRFRSWRERAVQREL